MDTIIHESVHIYQNLLSYMQEDSAGNEFQAYTIAHIATRLLGELKKQQELPSALNKGMVK